MIGESYLETGGANEPPISKIIIKGDESMKKNLVYPAILHKEEKGYWVEFPDLAVALRKEIL